MTCPLCHTPSAAAGALEAQGRRYHWCPTCDLVAMDPQHFPSPADERAHYLTHENDPGQEGYVRFLRRLVTPMLELVEPGMNALDYGCGPGPTVSGLFAAADVSCNNYDPVFGPFGTEGPYDAIVSTETFEHFHAPRKEIDRIVELLKPGGYLGILTQRWTTPDQFAAWGYVRDPTHTCFYHDRTFTWMTRTLKLELVWKNNRDAIILKNGFTDR